MIYGNVGAGLVGAQLPDNSQLLEGAVPNVQKLKGAAWGLPELDDIAAPELAYEKDVDTDWQSGLNQYYDMGKKLAQNALKLRQVGIDVTTPSPFVEGSTEAASLWQQDYNDWLTLGKKLKQSQQQRKMWTTKATSPNVLSMPLPEDTEISSAEDFLLPIDDKSATNAVKAWTNTWKQGVYGNKNLDQLLQEYDNAVNTVTQSYEYAKKQYPQFAEQLDQMRDEKLAAMTPPQYDQKFADMLALKKQQEAGKMARFTPPKSGDGEKVDANVLNAFKTLHQGGADTGLFRGYVSGSIKQNPDGSPMLDEAGDPIPLVIDRMIEKRSTPNGDYLIFSTFQGQNLPVQVTDAQGNYIVQNMPTFQSVLQQKLKSGAPFSYVGGGTPVELKPGTVIKQNQPQQSTKKTQPQKTAQPKQQKTFKIINPQTGKVLGEVKTQEEANKAIAKGYKVQ